MGGNSAISTKLFHVLRLWTVPAGQQHFLSSTVPLITRRVTASGVHDLTQTSNSLGNNSARPRDSYDPASRARMKFWHRVAAVSLISCLTVNLYLLYVLFMSHHYTPAESDSGEDLPYAPRIFTADVYQEADFSLDSKWNYQLPASPINVSR